LIGTKIDLRTDEESIKRLNDLGLEAISTAQGMEMSKDIGAKQYMECSALESIGVKSIFDDAIQIFSQSLESQSSSTWYVT
jgi:GTPase SAR1 family protein